MESSSHLAPELRTLPEGTRWLWSDGDARRAAFERVAAAWERADLPSLSAAVGRIDDAVIAGLDALELPRGPVIQVSVERVGRGWLGQKRPDCHLVFDGDVLVSTLRTQRQPDDVCRTWVHESLHARQPYRLTGTELRAYRGYEEGLVEGLARFVTGEKAGMRILGASYPAYVVTYRAVAAAAGINVEALWRALWAYPTGSVRAAFVDVVEGQRYAASRPAMSSRQRERLRGLADRAFASSQGVAVGADQDIVTRTFEIAFR